MDAVLSKTLFTWATLAAAVVSALLVAAVDGSTVDLTPRARSAAAPLHAKSTQRDAAMGHPGSGASEFGLGSAVACATH